MLLGLRWGRGDSRGMRLRAGFLVLFGRSVSKEQPSVLQVNNKLWVHLGVKIAPEVSAVLGVDVGAELEKNTRDFRKAVLTRAVQWGPALYIYAVDGQPLGA